MTAAPEVVVSGDRDALVRDVAARVVTAVGAALATRPEAHVVVTGGGVGTGVLAALRELGDQVDWPRVHVWWGDERFLPGGHADRNETQAREALLDHVPVGHVHAVPDADAAADPETAAAGYAAELAAHATPGDSPAVPRFDVLMLGVGDDGHVASLFPGLPGTGVEDATVVGVHDSPKPPPERVSLTFPAVAAAEEVWLAVAGADKAEACAAALGGTASDLPAARVRGRRRTLWLLDRAAAAALPDATARSET